VCVLQCVAVCCSVMQCVAMRVLQCKVTELYFTPAYGEVSSYVCAAVCCSVLQCVAVCAAVFVTMRVLQCKVTARCPTPTESEAHPW